MRQRLKLLAGYATFWIALQVIIRLLFVIYNHDRAADLTPGEVVLVFWHGLRMDLSMSGYFIMFTALILAISVLVATRWLAPILHTVSITGIVLSTLLAVTDAELYRHWGFRMDTTPLFYLAGAEEEALGSVALPVILTLIAIFGLLCAAALYIYLKWMAPLSKGFTPLPKPYAVLWVTITALFIIPIRGSFTVAPMNTGFVYFHKTKSFANHAAINVVWNFLYSLTKGNAKYPDDFFPGPNAEAAFASLYEANGESVKVFNQQRPNIVLFILESFTSGVVAPLGGHAGVTPNINALAEEGILFTNIYASGDRTDKGLVSILSGYPAQTKTSIIKSPAKSQKLPTLVQELNKMGYHSSFVYGGDPDFANFRSYLTLSNFAHLTTQTDFEDDAESGKWGVHDHIVFNRAFDECDSAQSPFFKVILSLSSHEPFDVPMDPVFSGDDQEALFLNACHYTDRHLGAFIRRAKASEWWENTVVIIIADHGHRLPGNKELNDKKRFGIPLLFAGGALRMDSVVHTIGSQTDLANTVLAQIDKPGTSFHFSKDLLSPDAKSFAAYFFNNGYGFVTPEAWVVYDHNAGNFVITEGDAARIMDVSKAYQHALFLDYNSK